MVFPVVKYGCKSWTIKKAQNERIDAFFFLIDAFKLWCWRRLLRAPWTERISNQLILKEIHPEYSLKDCCWSSNTLTTWCEETSHWKSPWCWEGLRQEEEMAKENEMVGWHHWLNGNECEQTLGDGEGHGSLGCCSPWCCKQSDTT